jgi:ABC-type multidrug transport system fused ATPase/permease subunit
MFFILLGIIALLLPWSAHIRTDMIEFILENSIAISLFGFGFIILGFLIVLSLYLSSKRRYYYVRGGERTVVIDQEIIRHYLQAYWLQKFPNQEIPNRLVLKKNRIRVTADLPFTELKAQKPLIERIKQDLEELFHQMLGYSHQFVLVASFPKKKRMRDEG